MKFILEDESEEVRRGLDILLKRLKLDDMGTGEVVTVVKRPGNLQVRCKDQQTYISYDKRIHFFRALGILAGNRGRDFEICEVPQFQTNGIMIDASRNGVMKVESIKDLIEVMAIMGLNLIMMYTEDTYEVPEYPYFGYMRGRYTYEELHECDEYADLFGIEMIPCIQTLAHLARALKWNHGPVIRDTNEVLLVGNDDTYVFLEHLIRAASKPFRSKRIHVGMDEAGDLGLGEYLVRNGYKTPGEIMKEHLTRVSRITEKLGLEAIMWPDMFFKTNADGGYYVEDITFSQEVIDSVPKSFQLVYWDYEHEDQKVIETMIANHKKLSDKLIFAGGIWMWGSMTVNYRQTFRTQIAALKACIQCNVSEVFATMWGDNGNQVNVYEALYGMQLYAEMGYGHEPTREYLDRRFRTCTGEAAEAFLELDLLDDFGQENILANPSEYLLWQDILLGLMDKHVEGQNVGEHYKAVAEKMFRHMQSAGRYKGIFEYSYLLARVLEIKGNLGVRIKKCYDEKDMEELRRIVYVTLPELESRFTAFKDSFRKLWMQVYKPFGFEVMDMRIGTVLARIETTKFRMEAFLAGEVETIEELEQERLPYFLDDWYRWKYTGLEARTVTWLKYVNPANASMSYCD